MVQTLVCKVDTELVDRIGAASHVLWTRKVEEPDKRIKVPLHRRWLICSLSHANRREYKVLARSSRPSETPSEAEEQSRASSDFCR